MIRKIPDEFSALTNLWYTDFTDNPDLKGTIPAELCEKIAAEAAGFDDDEAYTTCIMPPNEGLFAPCGTNPDPDTGVPRGCCWTPLSSVPAEPYPEGACDCEGNVADACGVCAGDASSCTDPCGVLHGDGSSCADRCGVPNGDNSNCRDACGVINGDGSSCMDACGVVNGNCFKGCDECGVCKGNDNNFDATDAGCGLSGSKSAVRNTGPASLGVVIPVVAAAVLLVAAVIFVVRKRRIRAATPDKVPQLGAGFEAEA